MSLGKVGTVKMAQGDYDSARKAFRDGQNIIARLTAQAPDNATLSNDFAWFEGQITLLD